MRNYKTILIIPILFISLFSFGQKKYNPKVIILLPYNAEFDQNTKEDVDFADYLNFENSIIQDYSNTIQEIIVEDWPNCIFLTSTEKSTLDSSKLYELAKKYKADLIINVLSLHILKYQNDLLIKPEFSVYSRSANKIINIKPFIEYDKYNEKFITINERTLYIYSDDIDYLTQIINIIKKEADINNSNDIPNEKNQKDIFYQEITKEKNNNEIEQILIENSMLDNCEFYSGLISQTQTQFLAFITGPETIKGLGHLGIIRASKTNNADWELQYQEKIVLVLEEINDRNLMELLFNKYKSEYFLNNSTNTNERFWKKHK